MTVETQYYGYKPSASYLGTNILPPPQYAYNTDAYNYPLSFKVTNENMMWGLGGLAAAFVFSKLIKGGIIGKAGYYAGVGAAGLALLDYLGIFPISKVKGMIPSF